MQQHRRVQKVSRGAQPKRTLLRPEMECGGAAGAIAHPHFISGHNSEHECPAQRAHPPPSDKCDAALHCTCLGAHVAGSSSIVSSPQTMLSLEGRTAARRLAGDWQGVHHRALRLKRLI